MISCMSYQCSSVNRCLSISCSVSGHRPGCWGCRGMFYSLCSHRFQVTTLTTRVFTGRSTFPPPLPSSFLPKAGFLCSCKHSNSSMLFKIVFFFFFNILCTGPSGCEWCGLAGGAGLGLTCRWGHQGSPGASMEPLEQR